MSKFVPHVKDRAVKNGTWFASLNGLLPIILALVVSLALGGVAVANYCNTACNMF